MQIESGRRSDFLARMGADQHRGLNDPNHRFKEYDTLARTVYLGHCEAADRQAERERLFDIFMLRVVNADDPRAAERYRYPVQLVPLPGNGPKQPL